jgi:hypothetical protein
VELLPLPSGPKDLGRLKRLYRRSVYQRYYDPNLPEVREYLAHVKELSAGQPDWLDREIDKIGAELEQRVRFVYPNRERDWTVDQRYVRMPDAVDTDVDETQEVAAAARNVPT